MAVRFGNDNKGGLVDRYINTSYDVVKLVSDNMASVILVASYVTGGQIDASIAAVASVSADAAQVAADRVAVELLYDNFDDLYLGPKAVEPTLDNDGNALQVGALYFDTVTDLLHAYTGAVWIIVTGAGGSGAWNSIGTDIFITDITITDSYFTSIAVHATPTDHVIHAQGGLGTDIAGADLTIAGGISTGSGAGGSLIFQTTPAGATSATPNALTTALTIDANQYVYVANRLYVGGVLHSLLSSNTMFLYGGTSGWRVMDDTGARTDINVDAAGDVIFAGALTVLGAFTSLGIDDNATAEMLELADGSLTLGAASGFTVQNNIDTSFTIFSGGTGLSTGANMVMYGSTHASTPGDFRLRSNGNIFLEWDESIGQVKLNTGIGTKTTALTIDASQDATFTSHVILPLVNDVTTPTLAFGDGDTGIYETTDDRLIFAFGGNVGFLVDTNGIAMGANGAMPYMLKITTTATVPGFTPNGTDSNTGIGWTSADRMSLIAGGVSQMEIYENTGVGQVILPLQNVATTPSLAFGDGDTGLYESADDVLALATNGILRYSFSGGQLSTNSTNGAVILNEVPSSINPVFSFVGDLSTGIGRTSADRMSLIAGGVSQMEIYENTGVGQVILPLQNVATTPSLAFGDGDTGFYESSDDNLRMSIGGILKYLFTGAGIQGNNTGSFYLDFTAASNTNPVYSFAGDLDTGIGSAGADQLSLIAGGVEMLRLVETGVATTDQIIIAPAGIIGAVATPSLAFGDGDTGFYESADDVINVAVSGAARAGFDITGISSPSYTNGFRLINGDATSTLPTLLPSKADTNTGIGWTSADRMSLIAGGVSQMEIYENTGVGQVILPLQNVATTPSLAFGDGDTGLYESADDVLHVSVDGISAFKFFFSAGNSTQGVASNNGNGPLFSNLAATSTIPSIMPDQSDANTGLGSSGADALSFITGGVERMRLDNNGSVFIPEKAAGSGDVLGLGQVWIRNNNPNNLMFTDDLGNEYVVAGSGAAGAGEWTVSGTDLLHVTAGITDVYLTEATTDAVPLNTILHAQGGVGTDIAGANLTIAGGIGTGTGAGGSLIFQTTPVGATSATPNALTTALTIDSAQDATFAGGLIVDGDKLEVGGVTLADAYTGESGYAARLRIGESTDVIDEAGQGLLQLIGYSASVGTSVGTIDFIDKRDNDAIVKIIAERGDNAFGSGELHFQTNDGLDVLTTVLTLDSSQDATFAGDVLASNAAGPSFLNVAAGVNTPTLLPNKADVDTGIGWTSADRMSFIAGGFAWLDIYYNAGLGQIILPQQNNATTPSLAFGSGDTGFFENGLDDLSVSVGGTEVFEWTGVQFLGVATNGPAMQNETAASDNPTLLPSRSDPNTGIGWASAGVLTLIETGGEVLRVENGGVGVGNTGLKTWWSTREFIQIGDAGSISASNTSAGVTFGHNVYQDGTNVASRIIAGYAQEIDLTSSGTMVFNVAANTTADSTITWINALTITDTGILDVANSLMVLDEDDMATDSSTQLATQQSIKAYVDGGGSEIFADCTADVSNQTITYATITGMSPSLEASSTYAVDIMLELDQVAAAADFQVALVVGTGAVGLGKWEVQGAAIYEANNQTTFATSAAGGVSFTVGVQNDVVVTFRGYVTTSGAGTANIQFAQLAAVANNTTIRAGSWARFRKQ